MLSSRTLVALAAAAVWLWTAPVMAQEAWGGVAAHGVRTPFALETGEGGLDIQAGYRFAPQDRLSAIGSPSPYVLAVVNTGGDTNLAAGGLSWRFGDQLYVQPGIGLALHDGPSTRVNEATRYRTDLGSRILFNPKLAVGWRISGRAAVEASWIHVSNAQLLSRQNPGLDIIGARVVVRR